MATSKRNKRSAPPTPATDATERTPAAEAELAAQPVAETEVTAQPAAQAEPVAQPATTVEPAAAPAEVEPAELALGATAPANVTQSRTVIGNDRGPLPADIHESPTLIIKTQPELRAPELSSGEAQPAPAPAAQPAAEARPAPEPAPAAQPAVEAQPKPRAAFQTLAMPAPQPADQAPAERTSASPAQERAAWTRQRALTYGGLGVLALLIALLAYRAFAPQVAPEAAAQPTPQAAAAPTAAPAPTSAPVAQAAPTAAQIVAPVATSAPAATAAPVVQPAQTAAAVTQPVAPQQPAQTAAAVAQPAAPQQVAPVAIQCNQIAGLPLYNGATCVETDTDTDNGVVKLDNKYTSTVAADDIRRFYEGQIAANGWALGEFSYRVDLGQRRLTVEVDTDQGANGLFTRVRLTERGAAVAATTGCVAIQGLPAFPNAACIKVDPDNDGGIIENQNTYATSATPEEVRRFYQDQLAQNGWAAQKASFDVSQGLRRAQIDIETQAGAQGSFTQFKLAEK